MKREQDRVAIAAASLLGATAKFSVSDEENKENGSARPRSSKFAAQRCPGLHKKATSVSLSFHLAGSRQEVCRRNRGKEGEARESGVGGEHYSPEEDAERRSKAAAATAAEDDDDDECDSDGLAAAMGALAAALRPAAAADLAAATLLRLEREAAILSRRRREMVVSGKEKKRGKEREVKGVRGRGRWRK
jgi:hypothetical protein